jgi:hypothetical protein
VVELCRNLNERARNDMLKIVTSFAGNRALLPLPYDILRQVGEALANGETSITTRPTGFEWVGRRPDQLTNQQIEGAIRYTDDLEDCFSAIHEQARVILRPAARREGVGVDAGALIEFLHNRWMTHDNLQAQTSGLWMALGLAGEPPIEALLENEAWRFFFEAFGAAVYERAIAANPPKRVHFADLLQLVYLAGNRPRILATSDVSLLRVAKAILTGRFPNVRAIEMSVMVS